MVSTCENSSHRYWISSTPRKAAKIYHVANWCLRSSGSLGGRCFGVGAALSRLLSRPKKCRTRRAGAGSVFFGMSLSHAGAAARLSKMSAIAAALRPGRRGNLSHGSAVDFVPQDSEEPNMQAVATIGLDIGLRRPLRSGFRALLDFFD